jgi:hypothetical protein
MIFFVFSLYTTVINATDIECLKHLGGAFAGVECYNGLSSSIEEENKLLIKKIESSIPSSSKDKSLFKQYVHNVIKSKIYCNLSRDALTEWKKEKNTSPNPRYYDYDVEYYQCVFNVLQNENIFLKTITKNYFQE